MVLGDTLSSSLHGIVHWLLISITALSYPLLLLILLAYQCRSYLDVLLCSLAFYQDHLYMLIVTVVTGIVVQNTQLTRMVNQLC